MNSHTNSDKERPEASPPPPIMFNGVELRPSKLVKDPLAHAKKVRALQLRDDDVLLSAFPKCGTHWMAEIINMLLSQSADYAKLKKESAMLDILPDLTAIDAIPSPRLLNAHLFFALLPEEEILRRKIKIVHMIRNPKDMIVSLYHHRKQYADDFEKFTFDFWLSGHTKRELSVYTQFDFLRQMQEFERAHPDHPITHVHYEDLKLDPLPVVKNVAEFLGVPNTEEFYEQVIDACDFKKLKKTDEGRGGFDVDDEKVKNLSIYRKGVIGDWKNTFTVAQNEFFDEFMSKEMQGLNITFRGL